MSVLLVTLGLALVLENVALALFSADFKTVQTDLSIATFKVQGLIVSVPRLVGSGPCCSRASCSTCSSRAPDLGARSARPGRTARWRGSWGSTTRRSTAWPTA
jgi:hypothetical protein